MKMTSHILALLMGCGLAIPPASIAQTSAPVLKVEKDGFPGGRATPEGAACDLARAFTKRDVALFKSTCIKLYGTGEAKKKYQAFLKQTMQRMTREAKQTSPSSGGPKTIARVFAARSLSEDGPASYGYAVFGFENVKFVDVGVFLHNGKRILT